MRKSLLLCCCLVALLQSQAQQFGGHPPATKWKQLNNDTVRIIFPASLNLEKQAADIATTIQRLSIQTAPTIGHTLRKVNIVLQPRTTISNAYVGLGPWRSEFYLMPPQNPFELGTIPWHHTLALHEYRHVQQYNNFRKGLSRVAYYLFGQEGLALANSAAIPNWFWEGDAVYQETLKSQQGRGRLPFFFNDYRSLWLANKNYSWMKLRNGSLRDFVPNHYRLGYMEVAYGREKYGADFWKNVTDDAARFNGILYPFQHAIKKNSKVSYKTFRQEALNYFKAYADSAKHDDVNKWAGRQPHFAGDEEYPQWVNANTLVLVKSSYKKIPAFYRRNLQTNEDTRIRTKDISLDNYFSYRNGMVVYAAYEADVRWAWRNYSVLKVMNIQSGAQRTITHRSHYFAPDISANGQQIVAVEVQPGGKANLHILDATSGAVLKQVPNPQQLFYSQPKFYNAATVVANVRSGTSGANTLALININDGSVEALLPYTLRVVGFPSVQGDTITFTAAWQQRDEVFALINKKLHRVLTTANKGTGDYQLHLQNNKAVYSAFTAAGYHLVTEPLKSEHLQPIPAGAFTDDLFAYNLNGLQQDHALPVDTSRQYPITKYRKTFNLINFHSWRPYISDPDYTFSLVGQNVLNTLQTEVYFNYNTDEKYKDVGVSAIYGGFFPYITLGVSETFDRKEVDSPGRTWNELNGRLGLQFPFTFTSGRYYRSLVFSGGINHHQVNYTNASKNRYADKQFEFADASVSFTLQSQVAQQHIYPRVGLSVFSRYRTILNKYSGFQWLTSGSLYLPGVARTHNLVLQAAYQRRDTLTDYSFGSSFPTSRGYLGVNYYRFPQQYKLGVNYHFPLVYPDWGVGNIVYFMRVRANGFYDYTALKFYRGNQHVQLRSAGAELFFDTKWWNEYPVSFGIRYSRLMDGELMGLAPNQWEFILPVNLLGR